MVVPDPASAAKGTMRSNGKKRSALEVADIPDPKRSRLPWPFGGFNSPGKEESTALTADLEMAPTIGMPASSIQYSAEWQTMSIPERIDALSAERREREAEDKLRSPTRKIKLDLQLDITPNDSEWKNWNQLFHHEILEGTVEGVLEQFFEEGQRLAIIPPPTQGIILDIQKEHTKEYKELLEGQLKGQKTNIITKLTMLHFGLPVEPLSLQNIINAGKDESDKEDAPEDLPRVQRIMFAEKPLQFLDSYHERSYGFPILRRPKPRVNPVEEFVVNPEEVGTTENNLNLFPPRPTTELNIVPTLQPIFPINAAVSMRGGAGDSVIVYGLKGIGLEVQDEREDSANAFLDAAFQILGFSKTITNWNFVVDQYKNQEIHKNVSEKQHVRSFPVNQSDFSRIYDQYLKSRLYNKQRDWPLVVRRTTDVLALTFTIPKRLKKPPALLGTTLPSKSPRKSSLEPGSNVAPPKNGLGAFTPSPSSPNPPNSTIKIQPLPQTSEVTPGPGERLVYSLDGKTSAVFVDDHNSFCQAACQVTDQRYGKGTVKFSVTLYSNEPSRKAPDGQAVYVNTVRYPNSAGMKVYTRDIADVVFKNDRPHHHRNWVVVAHLPVPQVPKFWPAGSSSELVTVKDYEAPPGRAEQTQSTSASSQQLPSVPTGLPQVQISSTANQNQAGQQPPQSHHKPSSSQKEPPVATSTTIWGHIHGFAGILYAENTATDFQRAGLQLLRLDPNSAWSFYFCMRGSDETGAIKTVKVDRHNFSEIFQSQIRPLIPRIGDWEIFVSTGNLQETIEPEKNKKNVVRITRGQNISYWKIPNCTQTDYGINQVQDDFFRAMSILFPPTQPPPQQNVLIGPEPFVDIGFGGMEVTNELWERVRNDLKRQTSGGLVYQVKFVNWGQENQVPNASELIGIRMVGSHEYASAPPQDYAKMQKEISKMAKFLKDGRHPTQFRLWKTARTREDNGPFALINYRPANESARAIKRFLEAQPGTTNCIWFRPEWPSISIKDITEGHRPKKIDWEADENPTLEGFCSALLELFNEPDSQAIKSVEISDPDGQHRFILSANTTESQWRKHIYDWFSGPEILVQRDKNITYEVEKTPPWGVQEPAIAFIEPLNGQGIINSGSRTQSTQNQNPGQSPSTTGATAGTSTTSQTAPSRNRSHRPIVNSNLPRINRERFLKSQVAPPKSVGWNAWSAEESRQDALQRDSYWKAQSVVEPGQKPEAPKFGLSKELILGVGSNMPSIYLHGITPSDFALKASENQFLRNKVLERTWRCDLCDTIFADYEKEKVVEHHKVHQDAQRCAGNCPLCGNSWAMWNEEQKKEHLWNHQRQEEGDLIRHFWQGFQCPVCDIELHPLPTEEILSHMAEHPPGLLKFCDRCGLDISSCLPVEVDHHKEVCIEIEKEDIITYCDGCGRDRSNETDQQRKEHRKACRQNGEFCRKCGIEMSKLLDIYEVRMHYSHCVAPRGPRKKFCRRCGQNLNAMSDLMHVSHQQECYLREPHANERERIEELERRISESRALNAKINAGSARFASRKNDLDGREADIEDREREVGGMVNKIRELENAAKKSVGSCPFRINEHQNCMVDISGLCRVGLVNHFKTHAAGAGNTGPIEGPTTFNCPLVLSNGNACNHQITIMPCGGQIIAHYQHKSQPHSGPAGQSAAELELSRRLPEFQAFSEKMRAAADKARADNARDFPDQSPEGLSSSMVEAENPEAISRPQGHTGKNKKSPTKLSNKPTSSKTAKASSPTKKATTAKLTPAAKSTNETSTINTSPENDEGLQQAAGTDTDAGTTGLAPRSRKRKAASTASPRKVSGKTPAAAKRKKVDVAGDEDEGSGEHPGFLFPNTPGFGKRQRGVREETLEFASSVGGDVSAEADLDREVSAKPAGVRRTTRATSGTPGPSVNLAVPVARTAGRPRTRPAAEEDALDELEEEEAEILRSPAKRGRKSPAKKGAR